MELEEEKKLLVKADEFERKSLNFLDQILTITREDGTSFTDQEISFNLYTVMAGVCGAVNIYLTKYKRSFLS